jgi:hypothetical protein
MIERIKTARLRLEKLRPIVLPDDTPIPRLTSQRTIVEYAEQTAHQVAIGRLDPRVSAELRGWCMVAMAAHELETLAGRAQRVLRPVIRVVNYHPSLSVGSEPSS